ncbi:MAG: C40 family peptidase [Elusimicrobia bacterium]|nr:C40 family peptidase [Elusimicrobiota bacterium]
MNRITTDLAALILLGTLASYSSAQVPADSSAKDAAGPALPSQAPDFDGKGTAGPALANQDPVAVPAGSSTTLQLWASSDTVDVFSEIAEPVPEGKDEDKAEVDGKTLWRGTQLNKGEAVEVTEIRNDGWARVNLPSQNYSGWVRRESLGQDRALAESFRQVRVHPAAAGKNPYRTAFLRETQKLEGVPYVWGGRSARGVDCSGLVQLGFSYIGMGNRVPRTAHEQRNHSRPVDPRDLKPGDLIFSAHRKNPGKVSHVVIYLGNGLIREAPYTGNVVRTVDARSRLGLNLQSAAQGKSTGKYVLFFGTYFSD